MLKFEEIISGLTNEQKINLICSDEKDINKVDLEGFDSINFVHESVSKEGSLYQAAISLNDSIIDSYISSLYNNSKNAYVGNLDLKKDNCPNSISESSFLNEHFLSLYNNSLREVNVKSAIVLPYTDDDIDRPSYLKDYYKTIEESNPDYLITENYLDKSKLSTYRFTNNLVIKSDDVYTIVKSINNGYIYAITSDSTKQLLLNSLEKFTPKKEEYLNGKISEVDFLRLQSNGEILNPKNLDKALDERFEIMYQDRYAKKVVSSDSYKEHYDELTIMYKNDGILPLKKDDKVCLLGGFARENDGLIDVVEEANKYNLNSTNYAHGYLVNKEMNEIVLEEAISKSEDSIALVYLGTNNLLNKELPDNQIELLKRLKESNRKVVAILYAYQYIDKRILEYVNALLTYADFAAMSNNIFDIVYGKKNPSGKTLWYTPISDEIIINPKDKDTFLFPMGYGLNYGNLKIIDFTIGDGVADFAVNNDSKYDSKFAVLLYENRDDLDKDIVGFTKFSLKAHEKARISIPISDDSFKEYNFKSHKFEIHGGIYTLSLFNNGEELISTSIVLVQHDLGEGVGEVSDENKVDILAKSVEKKPKGDKLRKKRFIITSVFFTYAMVVCIVLGVIFAKRHIDFGYKASLIALVSFFVVYLIHFVYYMIKKPKKEVQKTYEELIKDMDIINKDVEIIYPKPIKVKEEKENKEEIKTDFFENKEEEEIEDYLVEENLSEEEKAYEELNESLLAPRTLDPENVANGCIDYLASKGLSVTAKTLNQIFSALTATKLIYLKSADQSKLDRFVEGVQEYIDNKAISISIDNMESFNDLLKEEDSDISKLMVEASQNKDKVYFLYVKNATNESFKKVLLPFINKNVNRSNVYVIVNDRKIQISNNIYLLIDSKNLCNHTNSTIEIDVDLAEINKTEFSGIIEDLNINSLLNIIKENQDKIYIQEEDFKKFDDLIDELNEPSIKSLSNRTTLDFDKIYPMLIVTGMEKSDVIDLLLRMRIVPLLKKTKAYKDNKSDVIKLVSRIFNEELIPVSLRALNSDEEVSYE